MKSKLLLSIIGLGFAGVLFWLLNNWLFPFEFDGNFCSRSLKHIDDIRAVFLEEFLIGGDFNQALEELNEDGFVIERRDVRPRSAQFNLRCTPRLAISWRVSLYGRDGEIYHRNITATTIPEELLAGEVDFTWGLITSNEAIERYLWARLGNDNTVAAVESLMEELGYDELSREADKLYYDIYASSGKLAPNTFWFGLAGLRRLEVAWTIEASHVVDMHVIAFPR
ncbi:MAG: hypothetical protein GVY13_16545 [Alphaproteobacteria bacterium]|jgi:hypothetical protein|nr:hypothetical protein [Alphaproteobacteria bacterium]